MVISTSLALGLIIGFALFQVGVFVVGRTFCRKKEKERKIVSNILRMVTSWGKYSKIKFFE